MKYKWVIVEGMHKEFFITDKIHFEGNTLYLGYYEGEIDIHAIPPHCIVSFGTKKRVVI